MKIDGGADVRMTIWR